MRLLHFDSSGKLNSTDFSGKPIPPYAILSHRWGGDEVLFEDLVNDTCESKAGYGKILFCSEQAARDQLQYFWIDTCCIDKWNLRELSKAINSMFSWYQNATNATYSCRTSQHLLRQMHSNKAHGKHPFGQANGLLEVGHFKSSLLQYQPSSFPLKVGD
jgi:hypothetical protein